MTPEEQLHRVVRQLKHELEWAQKIGAVVEAAPATETSPQIDAQHPGATASTSHTPRPALPTAIEQVALQGSNVSGPEAARAVPDLRPGESGPGPGPGTGPGVGPGVGPGPGRGALPILGDQLVACTSLEAVREVLGDCTRCKLHGQGRRQIVYGVGNPKAELMFVGEGPGAEEDRRGEPFVGAAGELLTSIIEQGMGIQRKDVYIANVVKCRPPQNRDPEPDEVAACEPFLAAQIRAIKPKVIITLGKHASHALLGVQTPITRLRGKWGEYQGTPLMPTYHPAYLLRNPAEKRAVWEDVKEVLRFIGRAPPSKPQK